MKNLLLILACVSLGVCGQLLLKHGMSGNPDKIDEMREVIPRLLHAAVNPIVIAGFIAYAVSAALWLIVLWVNVGRSSVKWIGLTTVATELIKTLPPPYRTSAWLT